jgi:hypothetical protein
VNRLLIGVASILAIAASLVAWGTGIVAAPHATGYFAPVFSPDGRSVFAITRDVRAVVIGFGFQGFTPPAIVRVRRDRFSLVGIRLSDGSVTVVESMPPSPLEGGRIRAYHGAIFGVTHAHLRWADAEHLEYEIGVTRHDSPLSRTLTVRKVWDRRANAYATSSTWEEKSVGMGGLEPQQLHGDLEAIAVPGEEMMPCAVALIGRDRAVRTLVQTRQCAGKYADGITASVLDSHSHRDDIERSVTITTTYADLVSGGRAAGLGEAEAMLEANREMQRRGLYPRTSTLVAAPAACDAAAPRFTITDEEFTVGLFTDIDAAIAKPGAEVDKASGSYIIHNDYTTSRQINDYLAGGRSLFFLQARGRCWQMTIRRP